MDPSEEKKQNAPSPENLVVGTHFQLLAEGVDEPYVCVYVGMKKNQYLVVTFPSVHSPEKNNLTPDTLITARYLYKNDFFEFHSKILQCIAHPVDLMVLQYPDAMQTVQRRAYQRINCFISADISISIKNSNERVKGVIKDISKGGCLYLIQSGLHEENLFRAGDVICLKCKFPGIMDEQETFGTVVGVQPSEGDTAIRIQFPEPLWWVPPYP
jgi:c-di-GMP-binding flagellar brake protein YcgR